MGEVDAIFRKEAMRRMSEVDAVLRGSFPTRESEDLVTLARHAHSLKGTAGSLGHKAIESLAREIWTLVDDERNGRAAPSAVEPVVRRDFDLIGREVERLPQ